MVSVSDRLSDVTLSVDCGLHYIQSANYPFYAIVRCVSVSVCVTFVHSAETNKDIFEIFSPSGSIKPF